MNRRRFLSSLAGGFLALAVARLAPIEEPTHISVWKEGIVEYIQYDRALSDIERMTVENYLKEKWNL